MQNVQGWWLPDGDEHFCKFIRGCAYQERQRQNSLSRVKKWRTALDIGSHVGFWTKDLSQKFETVHAFEPTQKNIECFKKNIITENVTLHPYAVGEKECFVTMKQKVENSGSCVVKSTNLEQGIEMKTIDSFNFENVDYIKLDIQGYELLALHGAKNTILKYKPIINIEQKAGTSTAAQEYLKTLGAKIISKYEKEVVFSF